MPIIVVNFLFTLKFPPSSLRHFAAVVGDGGRTLPECKFFSSAIISLIFSNSGVGLVVGHYLQAWSQMGWFASHNSRSHSQFIWLLKSQQFTTSTNKHYILSFDLKDVPSAKGRTDTITSTTSHYDFLGQRLEFFAVLVFPSDSLRSGWMNYSFSWNELMFTFTWQRFMQNIQNRFVAKPRWESPSSSTSGNGDIFLSHKS